MMPVAKFPTIRDLVVWSVVLAAMVFLLLTQLSFPPTFSNQVVSTPNGTYRSETIQLAPLYPCGTPPTRQCGTSAPTSVVFYGVEFRLWIEGWGSGAGGEIKGTVTTLLGQTYPIFISGLGSPYWFSVDGRFGAAWSGSAQSVQLLVSAGVETVTLFWLTGATVAVPTTAAVVLWYRRLPRRGKEPVRAKSARGARQLPASQSDGLALGCRQLPTLEPGRGRVDQLPSLNRTLWRDSRGWGFVRLSKSIRFRLAGTSNDGSEVPGRAPHHAP